MKWERIGERTHEIVFDNDVKMLLIDSKPFAALVNRINASQVVIRSQRQHDQDIERIITEWVSHQPVTSAIVPQATLDKLLDKEGKI